MSAEPGLTFLRVLRSEWLKLQTLRSTWITLGSAVVVLILFAALIANHMHDRLLHPAPLFEDPEIRNVLGTPLHGFGVTQLIVGVLGVLAITGEYSTGMIRATFTAVPKRLPVLWAKFIVFAGLAFAAMLIATFSAFFVAQAVLGPFGIGLGAPDTVRVLVALAGFLTLVGLLGLGIGFVIRSTAGGIATLVGLLLVAPGILAALNTSWSIKVLHYLPLNAGVSMFSNTPPTNDALTPGVGTLVMVAWVAASLAGAAVLVTRRDA